MRLDRVPLSRLLIVALMVLDVALAWTLAKRASLLVPTFHMDGAFQTASGLFRIAEGSIPGRDFYPYIGIGPVLALLPAFLISGSSLTASVQAAFFMTFLATSGVFAVTAALVFHRRPVFAGALAAVSSLVLMTGLLVVVGQSYLASSTMYSETVSYLASPGNSLRPIRSFAPYGLALVSYVTLRSRLRISVKVLVLGLAIGGVAAVWSNDFAVASSGLLLLLVSVIWRWWLQYPRRALGLLWLWSLTAYFVVGQIVTQGNFYSILQYNFVDVRNDQPWYFGTSSMRVFGIEDFVEAMNADAALIALPMIAALFVMSILRRSLESLHLGYIGTATFLGGAVATYGGGSAHYFVSLRVWILVTLACLLCRMLGFAALRIRSRSTASAVARDGTLARRVAAPFVVLACLALSFALVEVRSQQEQLKASPALLWDAELGGYLPREFADHVAIMRSLPDGEPVVEEYFGLAGAVLGPSSDLKVDATIHALGRQRDAFASLMTTNPSPVVTTNPSLSPLYTSFFLSANWWFYRGLLRGYEPTQTSPTTVVWTRAKARPWPGVPCRVADDGRSLEIATFASGLYELEVDFASQGHNPREYSELQNNINEVSGGYVALDPNRNSQSLPFIARSTGSTQLLIRDVPGGASPRTLLRDCMAHRIELPDSVAALVPGLGVLAQTPNDFTDENWVAGVGRRWTGFFVDDTPANIKALTPGARVEFSDGSIRTITKADVNYGVLNVFLDGGILDPDLHGYPNTFIVRS